MLRILIIGAHPDDPEGVTASTLKWIEAGHKVRFLSVTNGQAGHQTYPGYKLVNIRKKECERVEEFLGLDGYTVLDIDDGYLTTEIRYREILMRAIREYAPDVIVTHRPWDYHPDHRNTSLLVQDCSYLVRVPGFLPTVPVPEKMPAIFYMADSFRSPAPFCPAVIFDTDKYINKKVTAYSLHESQLFDWLPWVDGAADSVPADKDARFDWLVKNRVAKLGRITDALRPYLVKKYGEDHGNRIKTCEGFEPCEYGGAHTEQLYSELFGNFD